MSIDQITAEALRLGPKERARLAESLWESLEDPFRTPPEADESSMIKLAIERDREMETGEKESVPHKEMMHRLRR